MVYLFQCIISRWFKNDALKECLMTGKIYYISDKKQFKNLNEPIFSMYLTLLKNKHIRMKQAHKH